MRCALCLKSYFVRCFKTELNCLNVSHGHPFKQVKILRYATYHAGEPREMEVEKIRVQDGSDAAEQIKIQPLCYIQEWTNTQS